MAGNLRFFPADKVAGNEYHISLNEMWCRIKTSNRAAMSPLLLSMHRNYCHNSPCAIAVAYTGVVSGCGRRCVPLRVHGAVSAKQSVTHVIFTSHQRNNDNRHRYSLWVVYPVGADALRESTFRLRTLPRREGDFADQIEVSAMRSNADRQR